MTALSCGTPAGRCAFIRGEGRLRCNRDWQAVEKLGLKVTEDAAGGSLLATGADQDLRGHCLPDTDDPRGPKGK